MQPNDIESLDIDVPEKLTPTNWMSRRTFLKGTAAVFIAAAATGGTTPRNAVARTPIENDAKEPYPQELGDVMEVLTTKRVLTRIHRVTGLHRNFGFRRNPILPDIDNPARRYTFDDMDELTAAGIPIPTSTVELIKLVYRAVKTRDTQLAERLISTPLYNWFCMPRKTTPSNTQIIFEETTSPLVDTAQSPEIVFSYGPDVPREEVEKVKELFESIFNPRAFRRHELRRIRIINKQNAPDERGGYATVTSNGPEEIYLVMPRTGAFTAETLSKFMHEFSHHTTLDGSEALAPDVNIVEQLDEQEALYELLNIYYRSKRENLMEDEDLEVARAVEGIYKSRIDAQSLYLWGVDSYFQHQELYTVLNQVDPEGLNRFALEYDQAPTHQWQAQLSGYMNSAEWTLEQQQNEFTRYKNAYVAYEYLKSKLEIGEEIPLDIDWNLNQIFKYHMYAHEIKAYLVEQFFQDAVAAKSNIFHPGIQNNKYVRRLVQGVLNQGRNNATLDTVTDIIYKLTRPSVIELALE